MTIERGDNLGPVDPADLEPEPQVPEARPAPMPAPEPHNLGIAATLGSDL